MRRLDCLSDLRQVRLRVVFVTFQPGFLNRNVRIELHSEQAVGQVQEQGNERGKQDEERLVFYPPHPDGFLLSFAFI